jgi:hypothetical protein
MALVGKNLVLTFGTGMGSCFKTSCWKVAWSAADISTTTAQIKTTPPAYEHPYVGYMKNHLFK